MNVNSLSLLTGYKTIFGDNITISGFKWILILGFVSSFHSFVFWMGKLLYVIACDGYLPQTLTKLYPTRGTARVAKTKDDRFGGHIKRTKYAGNRHKYPSIARLI
ncbi:hypothetical protein PF005_g31436 [Phytophthora fragariae]|uniref:Uncharacterized protein n=1 Tax=Phytophthora fragariae TaxID=53985 RepID=A0A6A3VEZ5_9STRA|nr:hypothetical protein PF003_g11154 [Phytophthora fragariae]KAE8918424.1 hypothetical protein PF009_g31261 [Phytophthora fragariae]KAE8958980.1 hypothetical protein PF011_g30574 [Phytophthora fragariae]KAE9057661.1 hypothetical protein PF010_g31292 [Phytophthora fragariae]KAE9060004.1 hypothetical protein PF007_g30758 [Phytophthora fragariae]